LQIKNPLRRVFYSPAVLYHPYISVADNISAKIICILLGRQMMEKWIWIMVLIIVAIVIFISTGHISDEYRQGFGL